MKKVFPLILLTSLLLSACSINEDEIFEKNRLCWEYKESLNKEWSSLNLWVKEIFYSPKLNTCAYTVWENTGTTVFTVWSKTPLFEWNTEAYCNVFNTSEDKKDFEDCLGEAQKAEKKLNELK
jgi:hypothetical protein